MTPAPLQLGQAPSELALNSAGFTPLALANALRMGSSSPVYVAGLLRREPRICVWSIDTTPRARGDRSVHERALARPGDAGDDNENPERYVNVDVAQVVGCRTPDLERACGGPHRVFDAGAVVQMAAGSGATGSQALDGALEDDLATSAACPGTEVDDVVGDEDGLGLVL